MAGKSNYLRGEYPDDEIKLRNSQADDSDEVSKPTDPRTFAQEVRRRWLRAAVPKSIMVDGDLKDVVIQSNSEVNQRIFNVNGEVTCDWNFEVTTQGTKHLTDVCLALDNHREHFKINSILSETFAYENINPQMFTAPKEFKPVDDKPTVRVYIISIMFIAQHPGTYCQDVIFGFNEGAAIRRQLCVDCVLREDCFRLDAARDYLIYLSQTQSQNQKTPIVPFSSPFVIERDPKEDKLCELYPKPDVENFFLTHTTLRETGLDPKNYRRRLHELVSIEEMARRGQIARYNEVTELRLSNNYILASDTDGSTVAKYAAPGELFAQLPLGREVSEDTKSGRLVLRSCNSLLVQKIQFSDSGPNAKPLLGDKIFEAHIEDKCNHMIYARISKACVEHLDLLADTNVKMYVQFVMNRTPFCEWRLAIDALPNEKLVFPERSMPRGRRNGFEDEKFEWSSDWTVTLPECQLNQRQKDAVAIMMAPPTTILPPVLILGPFGTGKTSTIAQALRILLLNDRNSKVILCTHSNSAADLYVREFFDTWYKETTDERLKPLRIYYKGRVRNTVHAIVREYCPSDNLGRFRDPTNEDLQNVGLVISTLATSSCLTALDFEPTHIIIDEAAQALECEALACLSLATRKTRLVLAGDQMQLAPEVYSDLARERGLGMSLLERIHLIYEPKHPCRIQLCKNYRAHKDIVKLTSDLFYAGEIEAGATLPRHPSFSPLTFYACEGIVQQASEKKIPLELLQGSNSTGFFNNKEAVEIAERVVELRRNWPVDQWGPYGDGSIGVLAHYAEQVLKIRTELRKRRLANVSVERVLNVQGKQFTAVFISVVRTRHCSKHSADMQLSDYGFLTNPRLLNTAVTRAKSLVAVVGDPVGLLTIGSCKDHWRRYLRAASVAGIDVRELDYYLNRPIEPPTAPSLNPLAKEFVPRTQAENPRWIEWVQMPINYQVIHCAVDQTTSVLR